MSDNNFEAITKLVSSSVKVKIPKKPTQYQVQVELMIHKISLDKIDILKFSENDSKLPLNELMIKMKPLFIESLRVTEDQLDKISIDYLMEIMEIIMDINMPQKDKDKEAIIEKFKQSRENK